VDLPSLPRPSDDEDDREVEREREEDEEEDRDREVCELGPLSDRDIDDRDVRDETPDDEAADLRELFFLLLEPVDFRGDTPFTCEAVWRSNSSEGMTSCAAS
jgi:hypothetical protein